MFTPAEDKLAPTAIAGRIITTLNNRYWDGKVHKAVKFGDGFDSRTVEGRKRAAIRVARCATRQVEVEALRIEERSWSFWGSLVRHVPAGLKQL